MNSEVSFFSNIKLNYICKIICIKNPSLALILINEDIIFQYKHECGTKNFEMHVRCAFFKFKIASICPFQYSSWKQNNLK